MSVLDCAEWRIRDLPLDGAPTTLLNFTSTRSTLPASVPYQTLNPLSGRILLTATEYESLTAGTVYAVMYLETDSAADVRRIRGGVQAAYVPSCIGGLVFEYTDEWWKGVRTDAYHTECFNDNATYQSTCGLPIPNFGPDGRSNEVHIPSKPPFPWASGVRQSKDHPPSPSGPSGPTFAATPSA